MFLRKHFRSYLCLGYAGFAEGDPFSVLLKGSKGPFGYFLWAFYAKPKYDLLMLLQFEFDSFLTLSICPERNIDRIRNLSGTEGGFCAFLSSQEPWLLLCAHEERKSWWWTHGQTAQIIDREDETVKYQSAARWVEQKLCLMFYGYQIVC